MILLIIGENMKKVLLSFALFLLIILLFIPFIFRLVGKNWYKDKLSKMNNSIESLNCNKQDETLNLTYLNNNPHNLQYLIKGNYVADNNKEANPDTVIDIETSNSEKTMASDLLDYSIVTYKEDENMTEFRINLPDFPSIPEVLKKYTDKESAKGYYESIGFSCTNSILQ